MGIKVAFLAHRANYLKHYGPIIDAALGRGWDVQCWIPGDSIVRGKEYLAITPNLIERTWGGQVTVYEFVNNEVGSLQKSEHIDGLISLHPRNYYQGLEDRECLFVTLQHSVDTFTWDKPEDLATSDQICLFSPYWWEYAEQYYQQEDGIHLSDWKEKLGGKIVYTGFAQMDAFAKIDTKEVRRRWGISPDRPVVLLMPPELAGWPGVWPIFFASEGGRQWRALIRGVRAEGAQFLRYWRWALNGWNDRSFTRAVKAFCKANNALLIVKAREKDPLRPASLEFADKTLYDECHYPPTVFEAIAIANVCILFYSTAAQEAAYAKVPTLCVDRPNKDMVKHRLWRTHAPGDAYNYPGVVNWTTIPNFIEEMPNKTLSDFRIDEAARQDYLMKYNGPADHRASERVLDLVATA